MTGVFDSVTVATTGPATLTLSSAPLGPTDANLQCEKNGQVLYLKNGDITLSGLVVTFTGTTQAGAFLTCRH
jgi:hypothetical protein